MIPRTASDWVWAITAPVWFPIFLLFALLVYLLAPIFGRKK